MKETVITTPASRVIEYLREHREVWPERPLPTAEEIRDALDTAHDPIMLAKVQEVLDALDTATVISALATHASLTDDPTFAILALERRGVDWRKAVKS